GDPMSQPIPLITVSGSAAQRGESYGRQAGGSIDRAIRLYRAEFARRGIPWEEATRLARQYLPHAESYDAEIAEEMHAIAKGANQSVESILILNARTELIFWKEQESSQEERVERAEVADDCTSAVALPETTADGHLLHGQNWDWQPDCAD